MYEGAKFMKSQVSYIKKSNSLNFHGAKGYQDPSTWARDMGVNHELWITL